jgi:hypothetical protein
MILQALHADKRLKELGKQGRLIIKTSDTDVIVLCIYFDKQMTNTGELWVQMGNVSIVLRTVVDFYLFMNYVLLSQKSHVEFLLSQFFEPFVSM